MRMMYMKIAPVNGQIVLVVPDAEELPPEWRTGGEPYVANTGAIYVATISDIDGEVIVEVWAGISPYEGQDPIYDGILEVRDAGAFVGSYTGNHLGHLALLSEGRHRVRVFTNRSETQVTHVIFVVD